MIPTLRPWLLVIALGTLACARDSNGDIDAVLLRGLPCHACSQGVLINASGVIAAPGTDASDSEPLTRDDRAKVQALIAQMPLDELRAARDTAPLPAATTGLVFVDVTYRDGKREVVAVPQSFPRRTDPELGLWIESVSHLADVTIFRSRFERLETAFQAKHVRSIAIQTLPGYGPSGRGYTAVFTDSGEATIAGACNAKATIPFSRVLDASPDAPWLLPHYQTNTIDASGARISIELTDGSSFASEGRAGKDWDEFFRITETRLDQIVRDATWKPSLDVPVCRRMLGLR